MHDSWMVKKCTFLNGAQ